MLKLVVMWLISWVVALITWLIGKGEDSVWAVLIHMFALTVLFSASMSIVGLFFEPDSAAWIALSMIVGLVSFGLVYLVAHFIER